jgi:hypothetical protein
MADEKKTNHEFQWKNDPLFFVKQTQEEEQQILFGPDLSWPLISEPESQDALKRQREKVRRIAEFQKAA